jgi:hypothetical protein
METRDCACVGYYLGKVIRFGERQFQPPPGHEMIAGMNETGGKPPADSEKSGEIPPKGEGFADVSFARLGQKIADLSRELSDITQLAGGAAAPR